MNNEGLVTVSNHQDGPLLLDIKYLDCRRAVCDKPDPTFRHRFVRHGKHTLPRYFGGHASYVLPII